MIRYAESKDINEIYNLGNILNDNFSRLFNIGEILKEDISKIIVYEDDNKILGFLLATCLYETVDILSIVVSKDNRRKRIGSNLIDYLISELDENVETITLEVAVNNKAAIGLYEKFGFEVINIRKKYYNGIDAYLMGRRLK